MSVLSDPLAGRRWTQWEASSSEFALMFSAGGACCSVCSSCRMKEQRPVDSLTCWTYSRRIYLCREAGWFYFQDLFERRLVWLFLESSRSLSGSVLAVAFSGFIFRDVLNSRSPIDYFHYLLFWGHNSVWYLIQEFPACCRPRISGPCLCCSMHKLVST